MAVPTSAGLTSSSQSLPLPLTRLIGREADNAAIRDLVATTRLVTLTGSGGSGKTRLAVHIVTTLRNAFEASYFVPLAAIHDPSLVLSTFAQHLGIVDKSDASLRGSVARAVGERHVLMVLDNFEQVVAAAPELAAILAACPRLHILATSRTPLHLHGEREYPVPPLALPDTTQINDPLAVAESPAVMLFLERARAVIPGFRLTEDSARTIAAICTRLDGLPLAIELAAARMKLLTPSALLARLDRSLALLTTGSRDAPARHRTLRAAIDWSHDLLAPDEQRLFARLAVFVGGHMLEAAEAICAAVDDREVAVLEGLASLIDINLLRQTAGHDGMPRFSMLETIREYAQEQLTTSGEEAEMRRAHAAYHTALAEELAARLRTAQQLDALARFDAEHDNFRAALAWSLERWEAEAALRLAGALGEYWSIRGHWREGRRWLDAVLGLSGDMAAPIRARALIAAARLAWQQSDNASAVVLARASLAIMQESGDKAGIADSLRVLGAATHEGRGAAAARELFEQSLAMARESGDRQQIAAALNNVANVAMEQGDFAAAHALFAESLAVLQEMGDKIGIPLALRNLGTVARRQGNLAAAQELYERSLLASRELGDEPGNSATLNHLGSLARDRGEYGTARLLHEESLAIRRETGDKIAIATVLQNLGLAARARGDAAAARVHAEESLAVSRVSGDAWSIAYAVTHLGRLSLDAGDVDAARTMCEQALAMAREFGEERCTALALHNAALVAKAQEDYASAHTLFKESLLIYGRIGGALDSIECVEGIAAAIGRQGAAALAARLWGAAQARRDAMGTPRAPLDEASHARDMTGVREHLGEAAWATAWDAGQGLTLEQAVASALDASATAQAAVLVSKTVESSPLLSSPAGLSAREVEVLRLLAAGKSNREIADILFLSEHTVRVHVRHIFQKTGTDNRAAATAFAYQHNLT
jgi:predicted ATPase/DNA-binding CsgD family transcriptional regulator/Tfp pilus assembly protein PilF